jgi:ribosomal protein S18 acetylase RimI-like enzyme
MEDLDKWVLSHPKEAILDEGGAILMALYEDRPAGTVALRKVNETTFEFTKMAVDEAFRRKGIAEALSIAAFDKARKLGGTKIVLYSQTQLEPAIRLYHKLGFEEVPIEPATYKRANIKMEKSLIAIPFSETH